MGRLRTPHAYLSNPDALRLHLHAACRHPVITVIPASSGEGKASTAAPARGHAHHMHGPDKQVGHRLMLQHLMQPVQAAGGRGYPVRAIDCIR